MNFRIQKARNERVWGGARATLRASDSRSGNRKSPKMESKVPGHRVTLVIISQEIAQA